MPKELLPEALYRNCHSDDFAFESTAELDESVQVFGQERAAEAVQFGLGIHHDGYNIFALGPIGTGKQFMIEHYVRGTASKCPAPPDLCYVAAHRKS